MNDFKGLSQRKSSLGQETLRIPSVREDTQKSLSCGKGIIGKGSSYNRPQTGDVYYSSKYLGVTKGQIGILSKRVLMPCLSAYQTCKDVPLSVINSALKKTSLPSDMIKEFIPKLIGGEFKDIGEGNVSKDSIPDIPNPEENDEFVIHTYARPNGLTAIRKPIKPFNFPTPIKIPKKRQGITGWKLSRPSTATKSRPKSSVPFKPPQKPHNSKPLSSKAPLSDFHNEIYLKYLHDKQK